MIEIKQKVISAKNRLTDKNDYYKSNQTNKQTNKQKIKWNQLNQIKENKNSSFKPMWHETKT